mgnify:CR=1 FL=1
MLNEALVRSIKCNGVLVDPILMLSCAYIEFMSLDGAQLMLEFTDAGSLIRDDYGFKSGAIIEIVFDDFSNDSFTEEFEVLTVNPAGGNVIVVNALQKNVSLSKVPARRPLFFVDESASTIIKTLLPDVGEWEEEAISGLYTYHLLQDSTPSQLIRKIERDLGVSVFIVRGVGYIKSCQSIVDQEKIVTLEYNNPAAERPISALSPFDLSKVWAREVGKAYFSWSMVGGMVGDESLDGTPLFVPHRSVPQLEKLSKQFLPALNLNSFGSLQMSPSKKIEMIFHRHNTERVIDESLPDEGIISRITHYQLGLVYSCNIEVSTYEQF